MMKIVKRLSGIFLVVFSLLFLGSCNSDDDNNNPPTPNPGEPTGSCFVQLFDGDHYTGNNISIEGPGEFADLEDLPDSDQSWDDEADSFQSGVGATVTMWVQKNFQGDSIVYQQGAKKPSIEEPRSMKIRCEDQ